MTIDPINTFFEFWFVLIVEIFCRRLFKSPKKNRRRSQVPDSSRFDDSHDEHMYNKVQNKEASPLFHPQLKSPTLSPCKSSAAGLLLKVSPFDNFFLAIDQWRKEKH